MSGPKSPTQLDRSYLPGSLIKTHNSCSQLEEERLRHLAASQRLIHATQQILAETTLAGLMQKAADAAATLTGARLNISSLFEDTDTFRTWIASGTPGFAPNPQGSSYRTDSGGIYIEFFKDAHSLVLTEQQLKSHPLWCGLPEGHPPLLGLMATSLINAKGKPHGVLMASDPVQGEFTAEDLSILCQLAALVSLGLSHVEARLQADQRAEQLRQSEQRFRGLAEGMPHIVWETDTCGELLYRNGAWEEFSGPDSAPGEWINLLHPSDRDQLLRQWQQTVARDGDEPYGAEARLRGRDGVYRWYRVKGAPVRDKQGQIERWVGTATDVDDQKQMELELRSSHDELERRVEERTAQLRRTIEQLHEEILKREEVEKDLRHSRETLLLAVESTGMGTFDYYPQSGAMHWSHIKKAQFGLPADAPVDYDAMLRAIHPDDHRIVEYLLGAALRYENGGEYRALFRVVHPDGQLRWIAAYGQVFRNNNNLPVRFIGITRDVTKEHEAEARRHAAEQALRQETEQRLKAVEALREKEHLLIQQSRHAAMGEMIGNIAHQWRQPLNTLGLTVQQLLLFYDMGLFDRTFLSTGVANAMQLIKHMSQTIDDFRHYFKPDKEKVAFSVRDIINRCISMMQGSLTSRQISIDLKVQSEPMAWGFPNEFSQVIINILSNARDVLCERSIASPKIVVIIGELDGGVPVIHIADNGRGIPEEIIDYIFDPYFTTKGPQSGTGLGLFMSKAIIENNMGGSLTVNNNADGAVFTITLNTSGKEAAAPPDIPTCQSQEQNLKSAS